MKKTARCVGAVLTGLVMLAVSAGAGAADPPGFETYVVRKGDTLSAIAGRVFGDPKRWREILAANPQVTSANRIYPGDSLLIAVPDTAAAERPGGLAAGAAAETAAPAVEAAPAPAETAADQAAAEQEALTPAPPPPEPPPPPVVSQALYRSAGTIADRLPELAIIASEDGRELIAAGDAAIVNAAVAAGERYTIVRADRRVFHPRTGEYLGWLIRVVGTAEVTCRDTQTSTVALLGTRIAAGVGDYLVPFDPDDTLAQDELAGKITPECVAPGTEDGMVVAFEQDRMSAAEQDLVFIDRGSAAGVAPGRRFLVYREIAAGGRVTVGELQVLRAGERTATALVTTSVLELEVGDLLRAR